MIHRSCASRLLEPVIAAALPRQRRGELVEHLEELVEVARDEELRLHPRDVVGDVGAGGGERQLLHRGSEAVDGLADRGEQPGPVETRRVERSDEAVLGGPPVEPARAGGLGDVAHARRGGREPLLGERDLLRRARGSSFTTERSRMASKTAWSSLEAIALKPTSPQRCR